MVVVVLYPFSFYLWLLHILLTPVTSFGCVVQVHDERIPLCIFILHILARVKKLREAEAEAEEANKALREQLSKQLESDLTSKDDSFEDFKKSLDQVGLLWTVYTLGSQHRARLRTRYICSTTRKRQCNCVVYLYHYVHLRFPLAMLPLIPHLSYMLLCPPFFLFLERWSREKQDWERL